MARNWQVFLAAFWLVVAVALCFRETLLPSVSPQQAHVGLLMSSVMVLWNLVRWFALPRRPAEIARPITPPAPYEYNPELDFQKMEREEKQKDI